MQRLIVLLILSALLIGCAQQSRETRAPASDAPECGGLVNELLQGWKPPKMGTSIVDLDLTDFKKNPSFQALADMNGLEENREKSYQILALLKKRYPEANDNVLVRHYKSAFRKCI